LEAILLLNKKIIVVTGGAGLLGRSFCSAIVAQGGIPIIADLDLASAEAVAEKLKANGGKAEAAVLDITDSVSVDNLITSLDERYGRVDAVINNAYPRGKNYGRWLEDVDYSDFCENVSMHLGGYFLIAQKFALYFRAHNGGNIVNMASIYGAMAPKFDIYADSAMTMPVEYAAIKSAVIQITRYFAQYFKADRVRCNSLSPGGIFDHQPDAFLKKYNSYCGEKGMLDPKDIVGTLVFLLSDASQYMNGQNIIIDDGFTL
jgi:NAD(P)-dependent dehydrogenase (short-subunit alcohol dehydrogenase family)